MTDYDPNDILEEIEHREKIEYEKNIRDDGDEKQLLFIFSHFFISYIELLFIISPQYIYACDISYYPTMSLILQPLFLRIILLFTGHGSLVYLCF